MQNTINKMQTLSIEADTPADDIPSPQKADTPANDKPSLQKADTPADIYLRISLYDYIKRNDYLSVRTLFSELVGVRLEI